MAKFTFFNKARTLKNVISTTLGNKVVLNAFILIFLITFVIIKNIDI